MRKPPLLRILFSTAVVASGFASCTELPNDVGVRRHRSVAAQTWLASRFPIFASWNDHPTIRGERKILINLTTQQAFFYRGKFLIGKTNISSGRRDFETPPGKYRVIQKDAQHISGEYGAYVARSGAVLVRDANVKKTPRPKGARFVGAPMPYFLRFTGGYGMHAGFVPRYRASHGCIRMPAKMAQRFFDAATVGTRVEVIEPPVMVER
jgi:L,D-transpeptidase catalytic domain